MKFTETFSTCKSVGGVSENHTISVEVDGIHTDDENILNWARERIWQQIANCRAADEDKKVCVVAREKVSKEETA